MEKKDPSPSISVVMATFNDGLFISEAIDSILSQSFTDFEFIIINDGSSDNTLEIINQYALRDTRIRVISRENKGLSISLNEGIAFAKGQWIARMDSDDISHPLRFERQMDWLKTHEADVCGTWIQLFGQRNQLKKYYQEDRLIKKELLFGSPIGHATVLMRSSKAKELQYDPLYERAEDYDFFEKATAMGWRFTNIPEPLYYYRFHSNQTSIALHHEQQRVSQKVRHRYWSFISNEFGITNNDINNVLEVRNVDHKIRCNSQHLNQIFEKLLSKSDSMEIELIFNGLIPLYIRIAGSDREAYKNLNWLCKNYNHKIPMVTRFKIIILGIFGISANSKFYKFLERYYLSFISRS